MNGLRVRDGAHLRLLLDRPKGNTVTVDVIAELRAATLIRTFPSLLADLARQSLDRLMRTHDASEGIAAFLERRQPQWRNA